MNTNSRRGLVAIVLGLLASAMTILAVTTGAMGSFNAALTNTNTAGTGTLVMQQLDTTGHVVCDSTKNGADNNTATCATDLYGNGTAIAPSTTPTTVKTTIKNNGTATAAGFTATAGTCTATKATIAGTGNLCDALQVTITAAGKTVFTGTATELTGKTINLTTTAINAGTTTDLTVTTALTGADNTVQGQTATQNITFTFTA